jgi:predicted aconitase
VKLDKEQENMLEGKDGRGPQKAMEIITAMAEAQGAEKLVRIVYAHLMPPDLMFMPYGRQGKWAHEMTEELTRDVKRLKVPVVTVEPKFCDLCVGKDLQYTDDIIQEIKEIQGAAASYYENLGVVNTYTAMPFLFYQTRLGQHVSISESIATLWFNTMFGSRCERDDGVKSLAAAITGYVPYEGAHLPENRYAEVIISPGQDLDFTEFSDGDWDAYSLAASRKCKDKRPVFVDVPSNTGFTDLKHLLAVIAVESGLAVMHIVGITPEAPSLEAALAGHKPLGDFTIGRKDLNEAYQLANTTDSRDIDFILMGCPHITMKEFRDLAEVLEGKKINKNVKLIVVTQRLLFEQARDMGYVDAIRNAGGIVTSDMCIAFAGTKITGTVATNSIKAVFFYAGFDAEGTRGVRFGSTKECARSALTGKWEGRF